MSAGVETSLEVQAERVAMALAEAGFPIDHIRRAEDGRFIVKFAGDRFDTDRVGCARAYHRALDLVGRAHRCLACSLHTPLNSHPRSSPDCEGTGRCAS